MDFWLVANYVYVDVPNLGHRLKDSLAGIALAGTFLRAGGATCTNFLIRTGASFLLRDDIPMHHAIEPLHGATNCETADESLHRCIGGRKNIYCMVQ